MGNKSSSKKKKLSTSTTENTNSSNCVKKSDSNTHSRSKKHSKEKKKQSSSSRSNSKKKTKRSEEKVKSKDQSKSKSNDDIKLLTMFDKYEKLDAQDDDDDEKTIGSNGLAKLFSDIDIDADTDEIVILFAWKCQAARMGFFTFQEFQCGMKVLGADSESSLQAKLADLRVAWEKDGATRDLISFVFDFSRDNADCKTIDPAMAAVFVQLLLAKSVHAEQLSAFLTEQTHYRGINSDQFIGVWEFATRVDKQLNGYEEDGAWPLLIDNFVEYLEENEE